MLFQVGRLPYAVLIDAGGVIRAKGLVNTREHIESLFEAMERGVESVQEYLEREKVPRPSPSPSPTPRVGVEAWAGARARAGEKA
jgi:hypothetical protein